MKFCVNCGSQMADEVAFCPSCGVAVAQQAPAQQPCNVQPPVQQAYYAQPVVKKESGLATAAKILMIISTVVMGLYLVPLAWCIPMTVSYSKKIKNGEPISTGFKICTLLFVNTISGILMLCDKEQ